MFDQRELDANTTVNEEEEMSYTEIKDRLRRLDVGDYYLKILEQMSSRLKPMEWKVMVMRFGLYDGKPKTLQEVGETFGITRERIRHIERKAIRHGGCTIGKKSLKDFLGE